jgi:hypothetical protein
MLSNVSRRFKETALRLGYVAPDSAKSVFEEKTASGADYRLGATLLKSTIALVAMTRSKATRTRR